MARKKKRETKRPIESCEHRDKRRVNNPPMGLVTPDTDPDAGAKKTYAYDPHLDPQLIRAGKAGQHIRFARLEPLHGCRWLHADGKTRPSAEGTDSVRETGPAYGPQRIVFSFGPQHAPLKQLQVERIVKGEDKGKLRVSVHGFDYYNTNTGGIESGGEDRIAVWLLDTGYDGRSLYPHQVFFPMAGANDGWARLAKNLKSEIDEERIEAASRIPDAFREAHPELAWRDIVGMRHRLVHDYFEIDPDRVWKTAQQDLPRLIAAVEKLVPPEEP